MGYITKNTSTSSYEETSKLEGLVIATSGLYYGFGCFSYFGGEILVPGTVNSYDYQPKN